MCGLFGFVGKPKDRDKVFDLMTELAVQTEVRGEHATGFVGFDDTERAFVTAKAPIKAGSFIRTPNWLKLKNIGVPSTFIGHCRHATFGSPQKNDNNHPFFSKDLTLTFVHNGTIKDYKDVAKKLNVELETECDSEVLLRILEKAKTPIEGIGVLFNNVFEIFGRDGACAMFDSNKRSLYLFRNAAKPLHIARVPGLEDSVVFASTRVILARSLYRALSIKDARIFEAVVGRVYKILFKNGSDRPKIEKEDIVVHRATTGDYFRTSLPSPPRCKLVQEDLGFSSDTGPVEVQCPCGSYEFVWEAEDGKICNVCEQYELSVNRAARKVYEPVIDDLFVDFLCEGCGSSFRQERIVPTARCPHCRSTWVTGVGVSERNDPTDTVAPGIWECLKCEAKWIAVKSPTCNHCQSIKMTWLGELGRPTTPMAKEEHGRPTEVIERRKRCKGCNIQIPFSGLSRCKKCAEIRSLRRKLERYESEDE